MRRLILHYEGVLNFPIVLLALLLHVAMVSGEDRDLVASPYLRVDETLPIAMISGAVDAWTAVDLRERISKSGNERLKVLELNSLAQSPSKTIAIQFAAVGGHILITHSVDRKYGRRWGKRTFWGITGLKFLVAGIQLAQAR